MSTDAATVRRRAAPIEGVSVAAFAIPTDGPEADGTLSWQRTVLVAVELEAGGQRGLGYTYADEATAKLVESMLADAVIGRDPFDVALVDASLKRAVRNLGSRGIAAMAISALDIALWDLKARLLDISLAALLGLRRAAAPAYGSGGFTTYSGERLQRQLADWVARGIPRVKMKVGSDPREDPDRVRLAREAIGASAELFVDANGAYSRKQALALAESFAEQGAVWLEEPVSSDDLEGLRLVRDRAPAPMEIAAGEYGYDAPYFLRMLQAGAVDVLQADATRCGGVSGFLEADALADACQTPLSAHCAPALHGVIGCAARRLRHVEYFYDHARIEAELFDGALEPVRGELRPDSTRPGLGLTLRPRAAARYALATARRERT